MKIRSPRRMLPVRIATVIVMLLSMLIWAFPVAHAASLTSLSLTLSTSEPDATGVTHTFQYTVGTATTSKGVTFQYCTSGSGSCSAVAGLSLASAAIDTGGTNDDFDDWALATTSDTITINETTGGNATTSPTIAFSGITNPSGSVPTTFFVRVTTYSDTGATAVIDGPSQVSSTVVPKISVTGTQDAILEMAVGAVNAAVSIGDAGDVKSTTGTSTATSLPFGTFKPLTTAGEESKAVAHTINVKTNGTTGYSASVQGGSPAGLTANGGSDSIAYIDGTGVNTNWDETNSSGFGVNAQGGEAVTTTFGTSGGDNLKYKPIDTSLTLASASAPTAGADTTVVFRVQVSVTQEAGDYSGDVNYTVLPGF